MKTVQDYLELGLAFVSGDKICGVTGDSSSGEMDIFDRTTCPRKYSKGASKIGVDCYARARWTPSSFVWRNNEGVKPDYKGLAEYVLNSGQTWTAYVGDIAWLRGFSYSVAKWRPVVLQSESPAVSPKEDKPMKQSREPKAIFSTESTIFGDRLRQEAEDFDMSIITGKPMKKIKTNQEANEIVAAHIDSMKPVYTAEMHSRNELPPVDSKVKVCIEEAGFYVDEQDVKFEGKTVTVKAAFSNTESEKIVAVENEDGNCYCYIIECIKPIIKTIKVNGFDVPVPMSEAPMIGDEYFIPSLTNYEFVDCHDWCGDSYDKLWLSRYQCHQTKSAAIAHAKAMLGINPNPTRGGDGCDRNVLGQNNEGDEI